MREEFGTILEPDPVAFTFDAPGWTYLMFLLVIILVGIGLRWIYMYRRHAYRRKAIDQLGKLNDIGQVNVVLKSLVIRSFQRDEVAGLHGAPWVEFLLSRLKNHSFSEKALRETATKIWNPQSITPAEFENFKQFSSYWIKHYHV